MDMFVAIVAFSSYFIVLLATGVIGQWKTDDLKYWASAGTLLVEGSKLQHTKILPRRDRAESNVGKSPLKPL